MTYSVGIDMGGTFTDGFFSDGQRVVVAKVPTAHFDLTRSVMACLEEGSEVFGVSLGDFLREVGLFRLATTIGTNAVVTGTGDPVGLMVEAGAEQSLYGPSEPSPAIGVFVLADHVVGLDPDASTKGLGRGETSAGGANHVVDVDPDASAEAALDLCRGLVQQGVRQTVVSLRGDHREAELRLRELVRDRYPVHYLRSMPLTLGWETAAVDDDGLRTSTAVLNAYLSRAMAKLLYRTEGILQQAGLSVPLLAARSDGTFSRMPRTTAISTYSSGPAAGLGLAAAEARRHGDGAVVGFDMGGTTLDLGLVRDGTYKVDEAPEIRGVRVQLPVPGIVSVGLGGSSIASADSSGTVTVGPSSAGAVPGPAAFGRGGTEPTLTDADLVLGLLADGQSLPGDIVLDAGRAAAALAPLAGGDTDAAARLVHEAAHAKAATAVGEVLARAGIDPAEATLYAFGGAGGLHAASVAELAGIGRVRSFAAGGVFSARGVADASVEQRYQSAVEHGRDPAEVIVQLVARARLDLEAERLPLTEARITVAVHHRSGQCRSAVAGIDIDPAAVADLAGRHNDADPAVSVDVASNWQQSAPYRAPSAANSPRVRVLHGNWQRSAPERVSAAASSELDDGDEIAGPVLVDWLGTLHAVPSGWTIRRDGSDSLLWERSA